jgi:hypothetical protein
MPEWGCQPNPEKPPPDNEKASTNTKGLSACPTSPDGIRRVIGAWVWPRVRIENRARGSV